MESENKNLIYTVDKVKLEVLCLKQKDIDLLTCNLGIEPHCVESYPSNSVKKCHYNYRLGYGEGGVYVGIEPNWERNKVKGVFNVVLEWNPNKVDIKQYTCLHFLFAYHKVCYKVMNVDMAIDIPYSYKSVVMQKRDVREYQANIGHRDIETRYLGAFGENGHIKLYNKKLERSKAKIDKQDAIEQTLLEKGYKKKISSTGIQEVWEHWTRFEITLKGLKNISLGLDGFKKICKLPNMYLKNYYQEDFFDDMKLNDLQRIALNACIDDIEVLYSIKNYRTRKKIEEMLTRALSPLDLDYAFLMQTYNNFFVNLIK